ncbi:unnamed protein product [Sphenostylis stenocarpa]|uniref:Uncharacterized protein n=1 Tax=Sphenostylis stenocarpa TaxID=92480 RepID=A0AA86VN68_9FABA|nr:unnamed protein product [Sphenostylis stenocarpa]
MGVISHVGTLLRPSTQLLLGSVFSRGGIGVENFGFRRNNAFFRFTFQRSYSLHYIRKQRFRSRFVVVIGRILHDVAMDGRIQAESRYCELEQKQYFEQRKRKQQNLQMMGSDNCFDSPGISGQNLKEHRSLDILNLLNLSTNAQQSNPFCPEGKDDVISA